MYIGIKQYIGNTASDLTILEGEIIAIIRHSYIYFCN